MSSPANFMDYPEWTPEQRIAVTLVEILRMKRAIKYPPLSTVTRSGQAIPLPADPAARGELTEVIA